MGGVLVSEVTLFVGDPLNLTLVRIKLHESVPFPRPQFIKILREKVFSIWGLGCWARKWGMRFQPVKCNVVQLTKKWTKKMNAGYTLKGTDLQNVGKIKYL